MGETCAVCGDSIHRTDEGAEHDQVYKVYDHAAKYQRAEAVVPTGVRDERVNHPTHYNQHPSGIECIEIVRHMNFNLGNVVKYVWRNGLKDTEVPLEDLRKAAWYLNDEIDKRASE